MFGAVHNACCLSFVEFSIVVRLHPAIRYWMKNGVVVGIGIWSHYEAAIAWTRLLSAMYIMSIVLSFYFNHSDGCRQK